MKKIKFIGYRTIKTAVGAALSVSIAMELGLKYATAAGIITILSVQSTKRQSLDSARQRLGGCLIALLLSSTLFNIFGYSTIIFGAFLSIFIPLSVKFNVAEGIAVNSVLVTHLLVERSIAFELLANELFLMLIGVVIALLCNLYMPSAEHKIRKSQLTIEGNIREILIYMADSLRKNAVSIKEEDLFRNLERRLQMGRTRAYRNSNNSFFEDNSYFVKYMEMRIQQFETLKSMRQHFSRFFMTYSQTMMIADFTQRVANSIHENNAGEGLLKSLQELRGKFSAMELPKTREEFENRAMLYQFLNDLERFITIKKEFREALKDTNNLDIY